MAIVFPRTDIFSGSVGFETITFDPVPRQEFGGRETSGATLGKDFGSALWLTTIATEKLRNDDAVTFEAMLNSLDGVIQPFEAYDLRRPRPLVRTVTPTDGTLLSVNANNKAIRLAGLAPGQVVSIGDYLSFTYGAYRALHQASERAVAGGDGKTPEFEVLPHLRQGFVLDAVVNLTAPRGLFTLVPLSKRTTPMGGKFASISFQAGQVLK